MTDKQIENWNTLPKTSAAEMGDIKLPFVFLDDADRPYMIARINDNPWIFYWHPDSMWMTFRRITHMSEVWAMDKKRLPDKQALLYNGFDIALEEEAERETALKASNRSPLMTDKPIENWADDELVRYLAVEVMGWKRIHNTDRVFWEDDKGIPHDPFWNPRIDANDWMMVVLAMKEKGFYCCIQFWVIHPRVSVRFTRPGAIPSFGANENDTLGRAVCVAAAKAIAAAKPPVSMKENTDG